MFKSLPVNSPRVSKKKIQRLLRHKSQATTEIYLKNVDHDLASAISLLEKKPTQNKKELTNVGELPELSGVPKGI